MELIKRVKSVFLNTTEDELKLSLSNYTKGRRDYLKFLEEYKFSTLTFYMDEDIKTFYEHKLPKCV